MTQVCGTTEKNVVLMVDGISLEHVCNGDYDQMLICEDEINTFQIDTAKALDSGECKVSSEKEQGPYSMIYKLKAVCSGNNSEEKKVAVRLVKSCSGSEQQECNEKINSFKIEAQKNLQSCKCQDESREEQGPYSRTYFFSTSCEGIIKK